MDKQNDVCACNGVLFSLINSAHELGLWPTGLECSLHPHKKISMGMYITVTPVLWGNRGHWKQGSTPGLVRDPNSKEFAKSNRTPGIFSLTSVHTCMCVSICTYMCTYTYILHRHISPNTKIWQWHNMNETWRQMLDEIPSHKMVYGFSHHEILNSCRELLLRPWRKEDRQISQCFSGTAFQIGKWAVPEIVVVMFVQGSKCA